MTSSILARMVRGGALVATPLATPMDDRPVLWGHEAGLPLSAGRGGDCAPPRPPVPGPRGAGSPRTVQPPRRRAP